MAAKLPVKSEDKWTRLQKNWSRLPSIEGLKQYKLPVREVGKSRNHPIRKLVHGSETSNTPQHTILLVGDTGGGKTLLVDAFINYIYEVSVKDDFRVRIVHPEEKEPAPDMMSQTRWVTSYTIHQNNYTKLRYTMNIIDTPGLGDTGGIEEDKKTVKHMHKLFKSAEKDYGISKISTVCLVLKSSINRTTTGIKYMIDETLSLFGKDLKKNITVLATFDCESTNLSEVLNECDVPYEKIFYLNNAWLSTPYSPIIEYHYDKFKDALNEFFKFILNSNTHSLTQSAEVLDLRTQLEEATQTFIELMNNHVAEIVRLQDKEQNMTEQNKKKIKSLENTKVNKDSLTWNRICLACHATCKTSVGRFQATFDKVFHKSKICQMCDCSLVKHEVEKKELLIRESYKEYDYETFMTMQGIENEFPAIIAETKKEIEGRKEKLETALGKLRACSSRLNETALRPGQDYDSLGKYIDIVITKVKEGENWEIANRKIDELNKMKADITLEERLVKQAISADLLVDEFRKKKRGEQYID